MRKKKERSAACIAGRKSESHLPNLKSATRLPAETTLQQQFNTLTENYEQQIAEKIQERINKMLKAKQLKLQTLKKAKTTTSEANFLNVKPNKLDLPAGFIEVIDRRIYSSHLSQFRAKTELKYVQSKLLELQKRKERSQEQSGFRALLGRRDRFMQKVESNSRLSLEIMTYPDLPDGIPQIKRQQRMLRQQNYKIGSLLHIKSQEQI